MVKILCKDCFYWSGDTYYGGRCHRHTPKIVRGVAGNTTTFKGYFPRTQEDDWCGEAEPREIKEIPTTITGD